MFSPTTNDGTEPSRHTSAPLARSGAVAFFEHALAPFGFRIRRGTHGWYHLPAVWRGSSDYHIAFHPYSGRFIDFTGKEGPGTLADLAVLLGRRMTGGALVRAGASQIRNENAREARERQRRQADAERLWQEASRFSPTGAAIVDGPNKIYGKRVQKKFWEPHHAALRYLQSRGLADATIARAAPHLRVRLAPTTWSSYDPDYPFLLLAPKHSTNQADTSITVHRWFLSVDGRRRPVDGKKGLGPKTDARKNPRVFHIPADPDRTDHTIALCEGLETGLAIHQATGWAILVLFDQQGLGSCDTRLLVDGLAQSRWSRIVICADNDASGTGQQAAEKLTRRLIKAGALPFLALPADVDTDWLDVLNREGVAICAHQLQQAQPVSVPQVPTHSRPNNTHPTFHQGDGRGALARIPAMPKEEARSLVREAFDQAMAQGLPMLIAGAPGSGKSYTIAAKARQENNLAIAVPTKELANEMAGKAGAALYHGRTPAQESQGYCAEFDEVIPLGENLRSIMAHKCHNCPRGRATAAHWAKDDRQFQNNIIPLKVIVAQRHPELTAGQIDQTVSAMVTDPAQRCAWLDSRYALGDAGNIVMTHASLARDVKQSLTGDRRVIIDEQMAAVEEVVITNGHIHTWRRRLAAWSPWFEDETEGQAMETWRQQLDQGLRYLGALLNDGFAAEYAKLDAATPQLSELVQAIEAAPMHMDGTVAEAVERDDAGRLVEIPLRALGSLAIALRLGTATLARGQLHALYPTRLSELIAKGAIYSTATPSKFDIDLVTRFGGRVVWARPEIDNLTTHFHYGQAHSRLSLQKIDSEFGRARQAMMEHAAAVGNPDMVCMITHKPLAQRLRKAIEAKQIPGWTNPDLVGWFGRDDEGHNRWQECQRLICWGVQRLNPADARRHYEAERALLGGAWQEWTDDRALVTWRMPSGCGSWMTLRLPVNPDQAAWEIDRITRQLEQIGGRLRAAQREDEQMQFHIYAHFPVDERIWIDEFVAPSQSRGAYLAARAADSEERFVRACLIGGSRSYSAINQRLRAMNLPTLSYSKIREFLHDGIAPERVAEILDKLAGVHDQEHQMIIASAGQLILHPPASVEFTAGAIILTSMQAVPLPHTLAPPAQ